MWKQIDVDAELENSEVKVHYNMLEEGNFDIGRPGMTADYDDAQNFLFLFQSSSGKQNMGRYNNPVYDRLMQQAAVTSGLQARSDLLHEAEQIALDDAVVIPIMYYMSKGLVQPYVKGGAQRQGPPSDALHLARRMTCPATPTSEAAVNRWRQPQT